MPHERSTGAAKPEPKVQNSLPHSKQEVIHEQEKSSDSHNSICLGFGSFRDGFDGFRRTGDVTMWGAFHLLRSTAQQMIKQGTPGAIVLVSSPHAFIPAPRSMAYNMSKAALEHMGKTAAIELAEHRIRVNMIQPGWTDTPGERKFASEETLQRAGAKVPLGRLGTAEEMADAILFLADPRHEYMTGANLLVDGGISLPWWANRGSAAPGD